MTNHYEKYTNKSREELIKALEDARYFGSDLNKFMSEKCRRGSFAVNNIDCISYCYDKLVLRINESKHINENWNTSQHNILIMLSEIFRFYNKNYFNKGKEVNDLLFKMPLKCEVNIIKGNYPYDEIIIHNMIDMKISEIKNQADVAEWLDYRNKNI